MTAARDRQKSYADKHRKPLEFHVGDMVLLKVSPRKGVIQFEKQDETLVVPLEELEIDEQLRFIEEPVEIMDREVKTLKHSKIHIIRVRWNSKRGPEVTWEREDQMMCKYPHVFKKSTSST
ncbi:hypothetical protein L1987_07086 [Smallanthus sonchifolius]|uniref:Uncharacterized protein n=1 Tax=Smallanthus sonchifolius TaxID=185202 RepID=A0ACB9K021_9ASTR|nr:hypothetical protein L1987_07086 [Smallanthus sonchifolius]